MFESMTFPHIRYLAAASNHNPHNVYKTCNLDKQTILEKKFFPSEDLKIADKLTHGKVYKFHYASYSPDLETPRRDVLVTKNDEDRYVRYEENKLIWK